MAQKIDVSDVPTGPGVYVFADAHGVILYVGKAINLARRVRQYFQIAHSSEPKTLRLTEQISSVKTIRTASEFDALLLEAKLISQYKPKYNSAARDDKSPLYIALTLSESLPRLLYLRGRQLTFFKSRRKDRIFGPFQSARVARGIMRDLRHSIPFCTQKARSGRPCFYTHLGLCAPCASYIAKLTDGSEKRTLTHTYRTNVFRLKHILSGNAPVVMKGIEREMKVLANRNAFEQAETKKKQIEALRALFSRHYDVSFYTDTQDATALMGKNELDTLAKILGTSAPRRIECIDISTIGGAGAAGSLVVAQDGILDASQYRRFRIRTIKTPNDVAMIEEVLKRRLSHREWPVPDLLLVDGGKPQLSRALAVLAALGIPLPVIALAKRREEIYTPGGLIRLPLTSPALHLLERLRDEAHRFAISYHRKLRKREVFATITST